MQSKMFQFMIRAIIVFLIAGSMGIGCDSSVSWEKVEIPGTVCGNGSQYKFFVHYSQSNSSNVVFVSEPGGACWDYESCTGQTGIRGAANPNGIPDDHMDSSSMGIHSPFTYQDHPFENLPTDDWNVVFLPYCTGDIHAGNNVQVYEDPTGQEPDLVWHHAGHANSMAVINWMKSAFNSINKLMVTGCSAGGTGSLVNYHFLRQELNPAKSYLLNDSGPIYPAVSGDNSHPLHEKIKSAWDVYSVIDELAGHINVDINNLGTINDALALEYPNDRLAHTQFTMDYNYSLYSYERFYNLDATNPDDEAIIRQMWKEDQDKLVAQYNQYDNMAYYLPYFRDLNDSHCVSIATFDNTNVDNMDLGDFIRNVLDDSSALVNKYEPENSSDWNSTFLLRILKGQL